MAGPVRVATVVATAFGSITGSYTLMGSIPQVGRIICFDNATDAAVFISFNGTDDNLYIGAGSFKLLDFQANKASNDVYYALSKDSEVNIKRVSGAPTQGAVYYQLVYAKGVS